MQDQTDSYRPPSLKKDGVGRIQNTDALASLEKATQIVPGKLGSTAGPFAQPQEVS